MAELWGESVPIAIIITKTKFDWKHVKGSVEYIELGNGWILFRFSTMSDREYVWFNRPWFVKGINFVLVLGFLVLIRTLLQLKELISG